MLGIGCGSAELVWQDADGYRWAALSVPRRGSDGFRQLAPSETGIAFENVVSEEQAMQNEHLYNGSGVTIGDVDGDGLADIYFSSIEGPNVLYKNLGDWRFVDVTARAGVAAADQFSTGATFADIDGDADLDLLVTSLGSGTLLFVNNGEGVFEQPHDAGLASGFYGTTMTLADVDGDGDLDLYVANNKVRAVRDIYPPHLIEFDSVVREVDGVFEVKPEFRQHYVVVRQKERLMRFEYAEPDQFYLNDGTGKFQEVPFTSGRFLDEDGVPLAQAPTDWGLAARFYDVDGDGDPDLYVCNDFESPDRLWINDGTGHFRSASRVALRTTSNATMAVDFADIDRDGDVDFVGVDMLDRDSRLQKTQVSPNTPDPPDIGQIDNRPQIARNTLFVNRGDGTFAEAAYMAGVEASGWSWASVFLDVDLDGYEDLLIANGHQHDFLDADTQNRVQRRRAISDWRRMRFLYPTLQLRNVAFRNNGDLTFDEVGDEWGFADEEDVSHGLATGDLDGDGDLDVVTNRLGAAAGVYRNQSSKKRIAVRLRGLPPNTQGIGAKIRILGGPVPVQEREVTLGGIYVSSSDPLYTFAAGDSQALTIVVEWRTGKRSVVEGAQPNRMYEVYESGAVEVEETSNESRMQIFRDVSDELNHRHVESEYNDFIRQPLLPNRLSQLGPGVSWYDIDRDGDEDLFIASGTGGTFAFFENVNGRLRQRSVRLPAQELDQTTILGMPGVDGGSALVIGQMNYEAQSPQAARDAPSVLRVDLANDLRGTGAVAARIGEAVPGSITSTGALALADYDNDGDLDLFVGGRVQPARYPVPASSRLFKNEGGKFVVDETNTAGLRDVGLVSAALFSDIDADGDPDLLLALEWGPVRLFVNDSGRFSDRTRDFGLAARTSRWNGITAGDFNEDGLMDIIATSWGRNTRVRPSSDRPLFLYHADFDRSGTLDLVLAQYDSRLEGVVPLIGRRRIAEALPLIRRRVENFAAYADATLQDMLGPELSSASILEANTLDHLLFLNTGNGFEARPLPAEAQLAPSFYAGVADFDGDGHEDLFLTQNFYPLEPDMSRYAAGRGLWLQGDGSGNLVPVSGTSSGVKVYGDQRGAALADYNADGRVDLVVSQNANATKLYRNEGGTPGLRVRLVGTEQNPDAIGSTIRLVYGDRRGPAREIRAGSGYWSQDGAVQVLGMNGEPSAVWVRWPNGTESTTSVKAGVPEVVVRIPDSN